MFSLAWTPFDAGDGDDDVFDGSTTALSRDASTNTSCCMTSLARIRTSKSWWSRGLHDYCKTWRPNKHFRRGGLSTLQQAYKAVGRMRWIGGLDRTSKTPRMQCIRSPPALAAVKVDADQAKVREHRQDRERSNDTHLARQGLSRNPRMTRIPSSKIEYFD